MWAQSAYRIGIEIAHGGKLKTLQKNSKAETG
jgi:hypothetical protein